MSKANCQTRKRAMLTLLTALLCMGSMLAYDFYSGGIYYLITSSTDNTVSVTYGSSSSGTYSGSVKIPSTVYRYGTTYSVTGITATAFYQCTELTPPTIDYSSAFNNINRYTTEIYVRNNALSDYKNANIWRSFSTIKPLDPMSNDDYAYRNDMVLYFSPVMDDVVLTDGLTYQIGAFVGDDCRGIAEYKEAADTAYWSLRIHSDATTGEKVRIRLFNSRLGLYSWAAEELDFNSNDIIGYPSEPMVINFSYKLPLTYILDGEEYYTTNIMVYDVPVKLADPEKTGYKFSGWSALPDKMPAEAVEVTGTLTPYANQSYSLKRGWALISTTIADGVKVSTFGELLSDVVGAEGSSHRNDDGTYEGDLTTMQCGKAYKVNLNADTAEITLEGAAAEYESPIELAEGWNWISFATPIEQSLETALAEAGVEEDDYIADMTDFAIYRDGKWIGTLNSLQPGHGYLYMSKSAKTLTPAYEQPTVSEPQIINE